ncbi:MAG: GNAT family N-acetyltransferase, partial [Thermoplasmata archaeon]|nr:GNAT family N-acetyltransferase [Thermoplasmata archaeon]NIY04496.1 GNAT family N-acetyltransferase [Thermoplasmata archaeon]
MERSPVLRRLDDEPVWSIVCFFVDKGHRGRGMARRMLRGALEYAASHGATIVEAYPTIPQGEPLPSVSSFVGVPSLLESEGFKQVARPSDR